MVWVSHFDRHNGRQWETLESFSENMGTYRLLNTVIELIVFHEKATH